VTLKLAETSVLKSRLSVLYGANLFVHVVYGRGLVFLQQGNEIPRGWRFSTPLTMNCTT